MTAKEAWNLIEPHINPMKNEEFNNKEMSEAFILCYIAMKEMGERESKEIKIILDFYTIISYNKLVPNQCIYFRR